MASPTRVIEAMIEAGISLPDATYASRYLRAAGPNKDYWPEAKRGAWKNTLHVKPHHAVNLVLAFCVEPLSRAAELVPQVRDLKPFSFSESAEMRTFTGTNPFAESRIERTARHISLNGSRLLGDPPTTSEENRWWFGATFGEAVMFLLEMAADPDFRRALIDSYPPLLEITVSSTPHLSASILYRRPDSSVEMTGYSSPDKRMRELLPAKAKELLLRPVRRQNISISGALIGHLAEVLGDTLSPPAFNENAPPAKPKAENETGPSATTDEPIPSGECKDETPRAARPATTGSHLKARRERDKSQVGFESYGNSSGGAPLPPTESPDEARPKRYG
jgi:hypothetical protein